MRQVRGGQIPVQATNFRPGDRPGFQTFTGAEFRSLPAHLRLLHSAAGWEFSKACPRICAWGRIGPLVFEVIELTGKERLGRSTGSEASKRITGDYPETALTPVSCSNAPDVHGYRPWGVA